MKLNLQGAWAALRSSFWFLPSVMVGGAVALAALMVYFDRSWDGELLDRYPLLFGSNAAGAREILSVIAGSMITIAGVTFSITIVALSLASNQYTPRILRNFMRDRGNQAVLGVFVSIFVYCLIVLRTIRGGEEAFVPSFSVAFGIVLAMVGIGFLIFFFHHIAASIQAATILSKVYHETKEVIRHLYPDPVEEDPCPEEPAELAGEEDWHEISAPATGYIQHAGIEELVEWAACRNCILRMDHGIGDFVIEGKPLLSISREAPAKELKGIVTKAFRIATYRTIDQDPLFGVRQIVDAALKALSPGINDSTTAINCLDYLGAILYEVTSRHIPASRCLKDGKLRVVARRPDYRDFVDEAFHEIRQNSRTNVAVILRMLRAIARVPGKRIAPARRSVLWEHATLLIKEAGRHVKAAHDRHVIWQEFRTVAEVLGQNPEPFSLEPDQHRLVLEPN